MPHDVNDLRAQHFRRLLGQPRTWLGIGGATLAAGVLLAALASIAAGAIAAAIALAAALAVVFGIADSSAADAFFEVYAEQRGLRLGGRSQLLGATPLLRRGDERYAERTLRGEIAPGVEGTLALYTYEEERYDGKGNRQTTYHHHTVCLVEVPESARFAPELYCQPRSGPRALESLEDVFRVSKDRLRLESEALDERYEIFAGRGQEANWLRQLFSPTFIVWLNEAAPSKLGFELVEGTLCCHVRGHREAATELDEFAAASAQVARRLAEEAAE